MPWADAVAFPSVRRYFQSTFPSVLPFLTLVINQRHYKRIIAESNGSNHAHLLASMASLAPESSSTSRTKDLEHESIETIPIHPTPPLLSNLPLSPIPEPIRRVNNDLLPLQATIEAVPAELEATNSSLLDLAYKSTTHPTPT